MRTRSQAVSPSGFVSLEDVPRRRKTRAQASTSPSKDAKSTVKKPATKPAPAKRGRKAATKKKASTKKATKTQDESSAAEDAETQAESGPSTATPEKPKQDETTKGEVQPSPQPSPKETPEKSDMKTQDGPSLDVPSPSVVNAAANLYNAAADAINSPSSVIQEDVEKTVPPAAQASSGSPGTPPAQHTSSIPELPQHYIRCPCCSAPLQCPNGHPYGYFLDPFPASFLSRRLTEHVATGFNALKRSFDEISADNENGENDHDNEVAATPSQKRRITGPPGSTPFAHRTTPRRYTANMKSYSEQRRRRELEAKGQITATLFRLPQLVAQQEAKAAAEESENPAVDETDPFVEKPNAEKPNTLNDEGEPAASSEPAAEPRTPETPRSAWGIRSFLGSVPRSLSRFLPTLTSSADRGTPSGK